MVIRGLENEGPDCAKLTPLRLTAAQSRDAVLSGDFAVLGQAMTTSTRAQENLHADLIGKHHRAMIEIAQAHKALGWKVNGAGGSGGSLAVLSNGDRSAREAMVKEIGQHNVNFRHIPIRLSDNGFVICSEQGEQK